MDNIIKRVMYIKEKNKYIETFTQTDTAQVYEDLALDLIAKKINACSYIRSIKRRTNYDGTQQITVIYDNNAKAEYTVKQR